MKVVTLIQRKPGTTRAAFKDYYEKNHAPLGSGISRSTNIAATIWTHRNRLTCHSMSIWRRGWTGQKRWAC